MRRQITLLSQSIESVEAVGGGKKKNLEQVMEVMQYKIQMAQDGRSERWILKHRWIAAIAAVTKVWNILDQHNSEIEAPTLKSQSARFVGTTLYIVK